MPARQAVNGAGAKENTYSESKAVPIPGRTLSEG